MYGDLTNKLILEAKRTQNLNKNSKIPIKLPAYNDELIRNIIKEVSQLNRNLEILREQQIGLQMELQDKVIGCQNFVNMLCLERNKRCLLAYQKVRTDILDSFAWENNGIDILNDLDQNNKDLSHLEQEYLKEYSELITELKGGDLAEIDISGSLVPPSDVFIDVRVLKDAGEIQTEYGVFNLIKDSQFFVRQSDVERLIQQGYLQKI